MLERIKAKRATLVDEITARNGAIALCDELIHEAEQEAVAAQEKALDHLEHACSTLASATSRLMRPSWQR